MDGRKRVVIERVSPEIDCGRFPIKRVVGETVTVRADVFGDGHDAISARLLYRKEGEDSWSEILMAPLGNDRWEAGFIVTELGSWHYTVRGGIDHFATWRGDLEKKFKAGTKLAVDRQIGAELIDKAAQRAGGEEQERLLEMARRIRDAGADADALPLAQSSELAQLMAEHAGSDLTTTYEKELEVVVERREALFSAWYELFPRSCCTGSGSHGTFRDCERFLPLIAEAGFDVVYFPPIHPIGRTNRKGKNNAPIAEEEDPGSPWAIGSAEGGHKAIHPALGTLEDFDRFIAKAGEYELQVAIDIAFQCSPDHPYVREHPEWFRWRPDGTVQYAENPPKKYEDIIPFDFESAEWHSLREELRSVFLFWIERGVSIFRVDNPHTKPFPFWEWVIREVKREHPDVIFLSEAFTRPKVMYRLAKLGFSQSYTYFSWRNTRWELEQYMRELTGSEVREFFRPNFWPNTPDILPEILQYGGRPAFAVRFLLAATLSASYGIYGPPFELMVADPLPGREEYLNSEKYEVRCWDWDDPRSMRELISSVNRIRRENPALQTTWNVRFCETDNDNIICYLKMSEDRSNCLLIAVNLDPFNSQEGNVRLPLEELGTSAGHPFLVHDLLSDERQIWHGELNRVALDVRAVPGRIWQLRPRLRRENDFDYYM
ncbi:MAG: alpha-1,4-glucan--maltose-1-phosphate maltosyltransferase [Geobacter sp.]|nr:alpha-1,4-glucan--maltose-1-phosphate maltosyltransferase [Geobacter sp.]